MVERKIRRKRGKEKERKEDKNKLKKTGKPKFEESSTSLPGGHQVDGVPPVLNTAPDQI